MSKEQMTSGINLYSSFMFVYFPPWYGERRDPFLLVHYSCNFIFFPFHVPCPFTDTVPSVYSCPAGLIDFLIGSHPVAENLRRFVIFKIFPMISPDGVFIGNTRYDYILLSITLSLPQVFVLFNTLGVFSSSLRKEHNKRYNDLGLWIFMERPCPWYFPLDDLYKRLSPLFLLKWETTTGQNKGVYTNKSVHNFLFLLWLSSYFRCD